jgi:pyrimidine-nucleoside phosphorylase
MRATDMIDKKRHGGEHTREELEAFIGGYVAGEVPDYQVAAWLMAVVFQGMTVRETAELTAVMAHSGDLLDLSGLPHTVDKHSTGGVGDKTSLVLAPLLAAAGAVVAKMSGRGLGHTGGTIDKLESIPGFRTDLSERDFYRQAETVGVVITGQSKELAPADGLLYALRDATATVQSLPLIAASIMSKKLAGGARTIVLDVKVGSGAFMKTPAEARELARTMLGIGERANRNVRALLSDMSEPLGRAVGNALEVDEAVRCLQGEGPEDLQALCLALAEAGLAAAGLDASRAALQELISSGRAFATFEAWVRAQGGDVSQLGHLERAPDRHTLRAPRSGYVARLEALEVGQAVKVLGGGRSRKGDAIDPGVGVVLHAKVGDEVAAGDALATLYHRGGRGFEEALARLEGAFTLADEAAAAPELVLETLA